MTNLNISLDDGHNKAAIKSGEMGSHGLSTKRRAAAHQSLEPIRGLGGDVNLDNSIVREAREQRCLRADGDAVLGVEGELFLSDLEQAHLQVRLQRPLVRVEHGAGLAETPLTCGPGC